MALIDRRGERTGCVPINVLNRPLRTVPNLGRQRIHCPGLMFGGRAVAKPAIDSPLSRDQDADLLFSLGGRRQFPGHQPGRQPPSAVRRGSGHRGHGRCLQRVTARHRHLGSETAQCRHHRVPVESTPGPFENQAASA